MKFYTFAEDMKAKGLSTSYIYATLSAIRYYNDKLGGRYEMPKDNKELHLEKPHPGALNRAWMDSEIEKACRISIDEAKSGSFSDPRNGAMLKFFNLIDIGECAGSGIPNILRVWHDQKWTEPIFSQSFEPDRITLSLAFGEASDKNERQKNL